MCFGACASAVLLLRPFRPKRGFANLSLGVWCWYMRCWLCRGGHRFLQRNGLLRTASIPHRRILRGQPGGVHSQVQGRGLPGCGLCCAAKQHEGWHVQTDWQGPLRRILRRWCCWGRHVWQNNTVHVLPANRCGSRDVIPDCHKC